MELTAEFKAAGWRAAPTEAVWSTWVARGGHWQVLHYDNGTYACFLIHERQYPFTDEFARPVHPLRGFDYCPEGWGDPVVPTDHGYWWRRDSIDPVAVTRDTDGTLRWNMQHRFWFLVEDDGQWLGPAIRPTPV